MSLDIGNVLSPEAERPECWRNQCKAVGYVIDRTVLDVLSRMSVGGNFRPNHPKLPT